MCKKHNALKSHGVIDRIEHRKSEDYSMLRPSIGIDWDDVTAPFNSIAIRMANEKYHPKEPYRMEEITSWANEGRTSVIKEFITIRNCTEGRSRPRRRNEGSAD